MKNHAFQLLAAVLLCILIATLAFLLVYPAMGQQSHYLKLSSLFQFERLTDLPYDEIRPMCWQASYCDVPLENVYELYTLVDLDSGELQYIMASKAGCFVYIMRDEIGIDSQPHLSGAKWVECE